MRNGDQYNQLFSVEPRSFRSSSGAVSERFRLQANYKRFLLVQCHFSDILGPFWGHFGAILGQFQGNFQVISNELISKTSKPEFVSQFWESNLVTKESR